MQGAEDKNSHLALGKNFLYILDYITVGAEMSGKAVPTKIFVWMVYGSQMVKKMVPWKFMPRHSVVTDFLQSYGL